MIFTKPIFTDNPEILTGIKNHCKKMEYKCGKCRYSAKKADTMTKSQCIFLNCPCDWEVKEDE